MGLPSVLLHDHLDGGLRPNTILELAEESGYDRLPSHDRVALAEWFDQSESGSLESYLEAFEHTLAVMQTQPALERVAYEAICDLADDDVVYAEIRFCPPLHTRGGLTDIEVIEAVAAGMRRGESDTGVRWNLIVDALRHIHDAYEVARVAVDSRHLGVVAFDLAGPEAGYPPHDYVAGCRFALENGLRLTLHAGESARDRGVAYIASAMNRCGAERIGHGVELIHDCVLDGDGEIVHVGRVAGLVRDRRIPLEMCPASNLATSGIRPEAHPLGPMFRAGFNVTLSTDNRLMSDTRMSAEFEFARKHHGLTDADLAMITRNSLDAAFCDHETKKELWESKIAPGYAAAGVLVDEGWNR